MKTEEIRPKELFQKYLELSRIDGANLDQSRFLPIACPGCAAPSAASTTLKNKFIKNGFSYLLCSACNSLFCSPRPCEAQLDAIYEKSESAKYWSEVFSPTVAEVRREKMFRKKAADLAVLLKAKNIAPHYICDVGAGYGVFLEELRIVMPTVAMAAVEPNPAAAAVCRKKGIETLVSSAQESQAWSGRFDLVISSEVIEHVFSPERFVRSLFDLTAPGGFVLTTGLGYEGFDILTLQGNSESVFPPHHLNFLSVKGFETLFKRVGFRHVEITTPGVLDIDIVLNSESCPDFVKVLAARGKNAVAEFQALLSKYKLSSHTWILAEK